MKLPLARRRRAWAGRRTARTALHLLLSALALTALCACPGSHGARVSSGSTPNTSEATVPGTAPATVAPPPDDALRRRDVPPEGVPDQLRFAAPVLVPCRDTGAGTPAVDPTAGNFEIGELVRICFQGFGTAAPIAARVTLPGGDIREKSVPGSKDASWDLTLGPTDPVGAYVISATQGTNKAVGGFTAVLPRRALVVALEPTTARPGAVFRFAIVTSSARQALPLDLYRRDGTTFVYATTLGPVTTDSRARGSYELATSAASPPGSYCVVPRPFGGLTCARITVG